MSIHVLAYNLKRVLKLLGVAASIRAIKASKALPRLIRRIYRPTATILSACLARLLCNLDRLRLRLEAAEAL